MAKKTLDKPKAPAKQDTILDEDNLPIVPMEDCEEFDPSGKKVSTEDLSIENDDWDNDDDPTDVD